MALRVEATRFQDILFRGFLVFGACGFGISGLEYGPHPKP